MQPELPSIPSQQEWAQLGFTDATELTGGQQSMVFSARSESGVVAVKLTDSSLVLLELMQRRAAFISELANVEELVAAPVEVSGRLVHPFGDWFVTATTFIDGERFDTTVAADAELMGTSLARLHNSIREVSGSSLPDVDALRVRPSGPPLGLDQYQPLHGDFNSSNLRHTPSGVRIFDLDDCGNGPVEFEVANALYMVLFDSVVNSGSTASYETFRTSFVAGYSKRSGQSVPGTILGALIDLRVRALEHWINHPAEAPIGIRTSNPEWIDRLRQFAQTWSPLTDQ